MGAPCEQPLRARTAAEEGTTLSGQRHPDQASRLDPPTAGSRFGLTNRQVEPILVLLGAVRFRK
jgi:hypothetical protein